MCRAAMDSMVYMPTYSNKQFGCSVFVSNFSFHTIEITHNYIQKIRSDVKSYADARQNGDKNINMKIYHCG